MLFFGPQTDYTTFSSVASDCYTGPEEHRLGKAMVLWGGKSVLMHSPLIRMN